MRQRPVEQDKIQRRCNFDAVEENLTAEQVKLEASRCLNCKNPRCVKGCPVNIQIPDFIKALKEDDLEKAGEVIRETSMLPSVCGRVCPQERQCEGNCVLGIKGEAIAIGALERYVGDNTFVKKVDIIPTGKKVAIVGSGCAGITAAADLRKAGHDVTIFEALHKFGGVLRYGIPPFRLPRKVLDREITNLQEMGVKFEKNVIVGKSIPLKQLKEDGFDAIFICSGAGLPKMMHITGENLNGVFSANEFLTRVNLMQANNPETPTPLKVGEKVAIIGGGNIGLKLAKSLEDLKLDIKIIEKNEERCEYLAEQLNSALIIHGDGTDLELLNEEDISEADVVVSVTNNDEKNLLCSLLVKQLGVNRVVSRVSKSANVSLFEKVGVDIAISSLTASLNEIKSNLCGTNIGILATVEQGKGEVLRIILPEDFQATKIMDLKLPVKAIVGIIQRRNRIIIPNGTTQLMNGDNLIIFTTSENAPTIREYFKVD